MKCVEVYKELYHQEPFDVAFCPYRISPLGAHIDHQYGKINGLAIDKGIHMAYHPKQNGVVELQSLNFPKRAQFFVNAVPEEKQGDWADHLRGAAKMLGEKYRLKVGLSGIIEGSLPIGGLSSSASVIICTVRSEWHPSEADGNDSHRKGSGKPVCWRFLRQARPELRSSF